MSRPEIAVVGTGIAGMAAGYFLRHRYDVVFYEKQARPGGHSHTVVVDEEGTAVPIDTGFMVYNEKTYPNLVRFFRELDIPVRPTSMSFGVRHAPSGLEYSGDGLPGLLAQPRNLVRPGFWRMLSDVARFNRESTETLADERWAAATVGDYVRERGYSRVFADQYLLPMSSAIWSTEHRQMLEFPVVTLVRFFRNHGLLGVTTHLQWYTPAGGSRVYRDKVLALCGSRVQLGCAAVRVTSEGERAVVTDSGGRRREYERVVLACHADEALAVLGDPTAEEQRLLGAFRYQSNRALLHTDESVMPRSRRAWASWNQCLEADPDGGVTGHTVYWMNRLQGVSKRRNYFVSINDPGRVDPAKVLWSDRYEHPVYDRGAWSAQADLERLNRGRTRLFCGSYFGYGFHEDAFTSALRACRLVAPESAWP